jgi:hypothetical protein
MSFQLKGTPVAMGVVNRFDSEMMILCGSPLASFTARKPSAPAPPDLLTTMSGSFMSLYLMTMPCSSRPIWSAPPPVPAGITNSTGLVGSQAKAGVAAASARTAAPMAFAGQLRACEAMFFIVMFVSSRCRVRPLLLLDLSGDTNRADVARRRSSLDLTEVNFSEISYGG